MRIAIAAGMLGLLATTALGAEEPRVAEACAADHARLCSEASINSEGATRCLRSHFEELSKPCRDALNVVGNAFWIECEKLAPMRSRPSARASRWVRRCAVCGIMKANSRPPAKPRCRGGRADA
jgi:hypothetical protein